MSRNILKSIYFICALFLFLFFNQCSNNKNSARKIVKYWYGRKISFEWEKIFVYGDTTNVENDCALSSPLKIVTYIDESLCTPCLSKYFSASSVFIDRYKDSVQYICVVYPSSISQIQQSLKDLELSNSYILYDVNDDFIKVNSLEKCPNDYRTFLLDKNDRVVSIGDPLRNRTIQKLYDLKIEELINNGGEERR